ncbi:nucleotidyltransferase family protein [Algibacillus agarilyticus]|uniref:nucleotidyltransferase family protein n=1 Tax=Algibacillus agarilyticus TaxID=2234133 RepID=UPI000DD07C12|nr:nucleotidyltransferase family protein [Algibacillus agarilyticus]
MATPFIDVLILSAGQSSRFKGIKQLAKFEGQTLLNRTITQVSLGNVYLNQCHVVLGANAEQIAPTIAPTITRTITPNIALTDIPAINPENPVTTASLTQSINLLFNPSWEKGMGETVSYSIQQLKNSMSSVLICLVDQPLITNKHYVALCKLAYVNPDKIIASQSAKGFVAPVIFPSLYFDELIQLAGDQGAKKLIQQHAQSVIGLHCPEALLDVDTQHDLARYIPK